MKNVLLIHTIVQFLGKAEIYKLDMSFRVEQDVFGLEISVCHALTFVEELEDKTYLSGVENGCWFIKTM